MRKKRDCGKSLLFAIMILAALLRLVGLAEHPAGVLPDEAYGAYNAWGLMTEGMDSRGYFYPVYFVAWGSGMSVSYSYLAVPLFRLFGSSIFVYRLPQAILGIVSVYAFYLLVKELWDERLGLLAALVLAINPWHIMNTRFALDANMAPGMFLLGVLCLMFALKGKYIFFLGAALFFGATLYSYVLTWLMLPLFLLLCLLMFWKLFFRGKRLFLCFVCVLFLLALPLLWFVAVNIGLTEEVRTPFFSIPRLLGFRGEELNVFHIWRSVGNLKDILMMQYDGKSHTASGTVGAYYLFTTPFFCFGLCSHIFSAFVDRGKREKGGSEAVLQYLMLLWFFSAAVICAVNENITIIHVNMLHIPVIFYGIYGIWRMAGMLKTRALVPICLSFLLFSFGIFLKEYLSTPSSYFIDERADEAIDAAQKTAEGRQEESITIFRYPTIKYSYLLWRDKPPVSDYSAKAVYEGDPAWQELAFYGGYRYCNQPENITGGVYILPFFDRELFEEKGFAVNAVNESYCIADK